MEINNNTVQALQLHALARPRWPSTIKLSDCHWRNQIVLWHWISVSDQPIISGELTHRRVLYQ